MRTENEGMGRNVTVRGGHRRQKKRLAIKF